jgi:hypothetical protein
MGILVLAAAGVTLEVPLLGSLETALIPVAGSARELGCFLSNNDCSNVRDHKNFEC